MTIHGIQIGARTLSVGRWLRDYRRQILLLFMFLSLCAPWSVEGQAKNSCLDCHFALNEPLLVTQEQFALDIHTQNGLNCATCHGGDPTSEDPVRSMGRAAGFRGKISRAQIPALCAQCHSDPAYMRGFNPSVRTDQLSQYRTSVHGQRLARGDTKVAVCTDCHAVHGILPAGDSRSRVHPLNIAQTCGACHSNADHMKSYPIPTDQMAGYMASVHHEALAVRGDLSAPNCSTCHGNHGAAPPGVASVEFVCATCHVFQAQLFDTSPHKAAFSAMGLPACVTCHGNHRITRPTDAMIGTGSESVCLNCHVEGDPGYAGAARMSALLAQLNTAIAWAAEVLDRAERSGMEVSQAQLDLVRARDALTKSRVTIHNFQVAALEKDINEGLGIAAHNQQAGLEALVERDYRRLGLGVSLIAIFVAVIGLRLYIQKLETRQRAG